MTNNHPLQAITDKIAEYQELQAIFIDAIVRAQYPRWVIKLAESGDNLFTRLVRLVIARYAGLEVATQQHNKLESHPKGFRDGHARMVCDHITTTIYKHKKPCKQVVGADGKMYRPQCSEKCVVAKKDFQLSVQLTGFGQQSQ